MFNKKTMCAIMFVLFAMFGCKGNESPTSPNGCSTCNKQCTTTVQTSSNIFPCAGGTVVITMTTQAGCTLPTATASLNASWASYTIDSNSSVTVTTTANNTGSSRTLVAVVDGQPFTYTQASCATASCTYAAIPTQDSNTSCAAGDGSFAVLVTGGCEIHPASDSPWLTITPSCSTCSTVVYHKAANDTNATRVGHITVGTCTYTVTQDACPSPTCKLDVTPTHADFPCTGGSSSVAVTSNRAGCPWNMTTNSSFIHFTGITSGTDSASVPYSVDSNNTGASRTATIAGAGQTVTITQPACVVPPTSCTQSSDTPAQTVTETVSCPFGGTQSASITVQGHGSATASNCSDALAQAQANAQADLNNKVAQAHTDAKAQAQAKCPSCSYTVTPTTSGITCAVSNGGIDVSASCSWTAHSNDAFVTITSGASGSGNGRIEFTVAANNTGSARTGSITLVGEGGITKTTSIPQPACVVASCDYKVPSDLPTTFSAAGTGNAGIDVSATPGCSWSASANVGWIGITQGSGTGNGRIEFTVAGNGGAARSGVITLTGSGGVTKTTNVSQAAH
jgi:hypothetical protein